MQLTAVLIAFAASAVANTVVEKRAPGPNEAIYLTNCRTKSTSPQLWSQYSWYADGRHQSQHGQEPNAVARVGGPGWLLWETGTSSSYVCCTTHPESLRVDRLLTESSVLGSETLDIA